MAHSTFIWHPDVGSQKSIEVKVNETPFGDGYVQRAPDGLNYRREVWQVSFTGNRERTAPIRNFLEGVVGVVPFKWKTPEEKEILVVAQDLSVSRDMPGVERVSCTFRQDFDYLT